MARTKQTGPEIKLYQIDTMVYLGTKNILTKLSMFAEFLKEGGVAVADQMKLNRARALERFDKNYKISDIKELTIDGQANETWLRRNGLLYSVDGRYELSPIANAIIREKITLADYCFLLLSKQWIKVKELGGKDDYKANLLSVILADFIDCHSVPVGDFVSRIGQLALDKYKDEYDGLTLSNQEAARFLIEPLLISRLIEENNGEYILNPKMQELAFDYANNSYQIKRIDQVACADEEYWNSFQYGFYDLINKDNELLYIKHYPHLFAMKELYKDNGALPLQQIVFGAPGTGKSFGIDEDVKLYNMHDIRTTFHPDSDYSTFVGAYKPQMEKVTVRDDRGFPVKENGQTVYEKKIVYKYTQQAFLKAYVAAWKDMEHPHVLVIEEINRGNCAQIFGDLFQLLDRNDIGFSKYPITADTDIMQVLNEEFDGLQVANGEAINAHYKDDVVSDVMNGSRLLLPNNLYIWATMNTSDQSLFPIDSAFKRRWEWKYVPISNADKAWKICVNGKEYDWWSFIEKINNKIWNVTKSEDKKLGYFFCKADRKITEGAEENNVISADRFVGKVLFYVYNDVYKDYGFDDEIFKDKEDNNSDLLFQTFFMANGKPSEEKIEVFLKNLEVKMASEVEDASVNEEVVPEGSQEVSSDINTLSNDIETEENDTTKYSFDGKENLGKGQLAVSIIEKYMKEHPNLSFEELKDIFPDSMMGNSLKLIGLIVKEDDVKNAPYSYQKKAYGYFKPERRYKDVNGVDFFVSNNWNITNIQNIIDFAKQQGWIIESK